MNRLKSTASFVRRSYERVAERFETGVSMLERRYTPLGRFTPGPFEGWRFLWQPALLGFVAMSFILAGTSFTNSPFKLDMANTWFFGEPSAKYAIAPNATKYILSVVLVYGGLLLLMRVWLRLAEVMKLHPGARIKSLWWMLLLWAAPMIVAPPLFSRDVFSYAAQGEMTFHHISPYLYGPFTLGSGPYVAARRPALVQLAGAVRAVLPLPRRQDRLDLGSPRTLDRRRTSTPRDLRRRHDRLRRRDSRARTQPRPRRGVRTLGDESPGPSDADRGSAQRRDHGGLLGGRHRARGQTPSGVGAGLRLVRRGDKSPGRDRLGLRRLDVVGTEGVDSRPPATDRDRLHRGRRDARGVDLARWIRIRMGAEPALQRDGAIVGRPGHRCRTGDHEHPARRWLARHLRPVP